MKRYLPFILLICFFVGGVWAQSTLSRQQEALGELMQKAHEGDAKALYQLAKLYDTGFDTIPVDSVKSTALYLLSAQKGYAPARNFIGFRYYNGEILSRNIDSALYWIRLAAEEGDVSAASNLGYLLSQSEDITHDYPQALNWLSKAAEAGVPAALSQLGDLKRMGLGTTPDTLEAISLYEQAAAKGDWQVQLKLLAMMGYKWKELTPDSALYLGIKYYTGDLPLAGIDLIEQVAETENPKALALLGDAYSKGVGVGYNHEKAIEYFRLAAQKGDPSAQFIIGELLEFFPDDDTSGLSPQEWFDLASRQGVNDSQSAYDLLYSFP